MGNQIAVERIIKLGVLYGEYSIKELG